SQVQGHALGLSICPSKQEIVAGEMGPSISLRCRNPAQNSVEMGHSRRNHRPPGRVPPAYADAWAGFQTEKPRHISEAEWRRAVDDAGRFLDDWASLALDFGWRPDEIFGPAGVAWFCAGERVRAFGPGNAVTTSGRIFARYAIAITS